MTPYINVDGYYPPPYTCLDVSMYGFIIGADKDKIRAYIDRVLNFPANDKRHYHVPSHYVMVTFVQMGRVYPGGQYAERGYGTESEVTFWVPLFRMNRNPHSSEWETDWLKPIFFPAHLYIDNPTALTAGREVYGFNKEMGRLQMPTSGAEPDAFSLDIYSLKTFSPNTGGAYNRLLTINRVGDPPDADDGSLLDRLGDLVEAAKTALLNKVLDNLHISLPTNLLDLEIPQVNLKQFRDVSGGEAACYQAITETDATIDRFTGGLLFGDYEMQLEEVASAPLFDELGLKSGRSVLQFQINMDMTMQAGQVVWSADPAARPVPALPEAPATPAPSGKQKIAVLGGGAGALAAVFALTDQAGWQDRYEITVYQMGWRLGGKGASGRNQSNHNRIEEHGLHVWGGFYDNAFRVIQKCYQELNRPPSVPIHSWEQAFLPQTEFFVMEADTEGNWKPWYFHIPARDSLPGNPSNPDEPAPPRSFIDYGLLLLNWIQHHMSMHLEAPEAPGDSDHQAHFLTRWEDDLKGVLGHLEAIAVNDAAWLLKVIEPLLHKVDDGVADMLVGALDHLRDWFWERVQQQVKSDGELRHAWILVDFAVSMLRGMLHDRLFTRPFDSINGLSQVEWLQQHGASQITLQSALVTALHDIMFAFEGGDHSKPNIEAGTGLRLDLSLMDFRGAVIYRMAAGMGDIIFAPLYEVLKQRGVRFAFLHQVMNLGLSADQSAIERIEIARQATPRNRAYEPLIEVNRLPCWPSNPLYDQLVEGDWLRAQDIDLEDSGNTWPPVETVTLQAGHDFDTVIFGLSLGSVPIVCQELLAASAAWRDMVQQVGTVGTQAMQLWLHPTVGELGWSAPTPPFVGGLPGTALDTYCDMQHLIPQESWPEGSIGEIAYFAGVLPDAVGQVTDSALDVTRANALDLLGNIGKMWPQVGASGFDWGKLATADQSQSVKAFYDQYFRANVQGSERYVLTLAGTTQYRLPVNATGFGRLYVVGDWTKNGINVGTVESAVTSGLLVSQALTGYPTAISGLNDF
jgi:uncharacterized protein with NAD-binding domain and iron-sulfur cluster